MLHGQLQERIHSWPPLLCRSCIRWVRINHRESEEAFQRSGWSQAGGGVIKMEEIRSYLALVRAEFVRGRMSGCFQFRPPTLRKHLECETVLYRACMQVSWQATIFAWPTDVCTDDSVCSNSNQVTHKPILNICYSQGFSWNMLLNFGKHKPVKKLLKKRILYVVWIGSPLCSIYCSLCNTEVKQSRPAVRSFNVTPKLILMFFINSRQPKT